MNDQTFHTPSFGDEEFDIPAINPEQQHPSAQQGLSYQQQQHMQQMNQQQDSMGMHDPSGGYQQPLYLSGPDHGIVNPSYHSPQPQPNYTMSPSQQQQQQQQQQQHNNQMLMMQQQQQQQQQQQMMMNHGQPPPGAIGQYNGPPAQGRGNSPPVVPGQEPTTSEDSDDSTPHPAMMTAMKRPSPEPADQGLPKVQKKPKAQKKKKKKDPNEPQKPVSAYALFFRDTQAAIKGQNPSASFGEVSKIVASMWDALDSEHKNVYKKKTEAAKKEYLKALAAYRASLVSKGAGENEGMYGNYGNYGAGPPPQYNAYSPQNTLPSPPMTTAPTPPINQQQPAMSKKPMMSNMNNQPHQGMMQSLVGPVPNHMNMTQHIQQHNNSYMQQQQVAQHQQHMQHVSPPPLVSSSPPVSSAGPASSQVSPASMAQQNVPQGSMRPNSCLRHGCPNPAISSPEWEDEYCSNECVVSHCRDVFSNWVGPNQNPSQNYSTVK